jgi:phosphate transport system protein
MTIQAVQAQSPEKKITNLLVSMGLKVDKAVEQAITALLDSNGHVVAGLMENAVAIQELEITIDQAIFAALEEGDLLPSEIRQVTSMININKDLARLGRLAANLGRRVSQVGEHREHEDFSRLQPLAIAVSHLCRQTLRSLTRLDPILARNAAGAVDIIDAYRNYVFRGAPDRSATQVNDEQNIHLIFASRCLEQIADQTLNLAENLVVFLANALSPHGTRPETRRPLAC